MLTNRCHGLADNPYPYPSDELEAHRLDRMNDIFVLLYGSNVLVPISNTPVTQILDLGTGSGLSVQNVSDKREMGNPSGGRIS